MAYNASQKTFRLQPGEAATLVAIEELHEEQLSEVMLRAAQREFEAIARESVCRACGRPFDPVALESAPDPPEHGEYGLRNFRLSPETLRYFNAIKDTGEMTGADTARELLARQWAWTAALRLPCPCGKSWPWQYRAGFMTARVKLEKLVAADMQARGLLAESTNGPA